MNKSRVYEPHTDLDGNRPIDPAWSGENACHEMAIQHPVVNRSAEVLHARTDWSRMKVSLVAGLTVAALSAPACGANSHVAAAQASTSCPSSDFEEFLKVFANDQHLQARYIAPQVKTTNVDLDVGEDYVSRMVSRDEFLARREFEITYRDGEFHPSDAAPSIEPSALPYRVRLQEMPDGSYLAGVPESVEGYDFRFEWRNDCWLLTEGPGVAKAA